MSVVLCKENSNEHALSGFVAHISMLAVIVRTRYETLTQRIKLLETINN